jgi:hypothetical protein
MQQRCLRNLWVVGGGRLYTWSAGAPAKQLPSRVRLAACCMLRCQRLQAFRLRAIGARSLVRLVGIALSRSRVCSRGSSACRAVHVPPCRPGTQWAEARGGVGALSCAAPKEGWGGVGHWARPLLVARSRSLLRLCVGRAGARPSGAGRQQQGQGRRAQWATLTCNLLQRPPRDRRLPISNAFKHAHLTMPLPTVIIQPPTPIPPHTNKGGRCQPQARVGLAMDQLAGSSAAHSGCAPSHPAAGAPPSAALTAAAARWPPCPRPAGPKHQCSVQQSNSGVHAAATRHGRRQRHGQKAAWLCRVERRGRKTPAGSRPAALARPRTRSSVGSAVLHCTSGEWVQERCRRSAAQQDLASPLKKSHGGEGARSPSDHSSGAAMLSMSWQAARRHCPSSWQPIRGAAPWLRST